VRTRALFVLTALCVTATAAAQPREIRLWSGKAPGSESWSLPEVVTQGPAGITSFANVSDPTLTVYLPDPSRATGAAVVVAPGGALRFLSWDNEGVKAAAWLNSKGIAAFVLKYRTRQSAVGGRRGAPPIPPAPGVGGRGDAPGAAASRQEMVIRNGNANPAPDDATLTEVFHMGIADVQQAVRLVRRNATEWRIDTTRVGLMGFSAGGGVAVGAALAERSDASPDFLISVYGPSLMDVNVPTHAPPLFIAVGSTHFNVTNGCLALFAAWKAAGKPAELHVYDQVSGAFGMTARGLPVDAWTDRLHEWLVARKITTDP
jgi:acetyl esterase/lipase